MKIAALTAILLVGSNLSARSEVALYLAPGFDSAASGEEADIEKVVSRLRAFDEQDIFPQLASLPASLRLARMLVMETGLQIDPAGLAAVIREQAKLQGGLRENRPRLSIERIVVFDKELARTRGIPEELRSSLQYRPVGDVLLLKDSPVHWILLRDSSLAADLAQQRWTDGLKDHECQTLDHLQRKKTSALFDFFLGIFDQRLVLQSDVEDATAGKILVAWSATGLICGQFRAERAYAEWLKPHPDQSIHAMLQAAGGEEILTQRFAEWTGNRLEKLKTIGKFTLR